MSKHTANAYVVYYKPTYSNEPIFLLSNYELKGDGFVSVMEQQFEFEVPDDFNPVAEMVSDLKDKKQKLRLELAEKLTEIDNQISKLTCLTNDVMEAA